MNDYDEEFGPNRVNRCPECGAILMTDEVCWCTSDDEEFTNEK